MLRSALDSILQQDYAGQIDVIVVFDQADPDRSLEQHDALRSVRVIANTRTPGLSGARNSGILESGDAEYVAFCDDDDTWLPRKITEQVTVLVDDDGAGLCTTGIVINYDGRAIPRPSPVDVLDHRTLLRDRTPEAHSSTFLFRRSVFDEVGLIDEDIPGGYSEDYDILLRVARVRRIRCVRTPLATIHWGRTSYFQTRWQTTVMAQRYLLEKHPEFGRDRRAECRVRGQIAFALAALGERRSTFREVGAILRRWPLEKRWPIAVLVALRVVSADRALALAHRFGRGI
ncbi:MAG: glycosyltransferase [Rhodococcus sp.]|nr:glycosyltransferase [Rhodococcus sp. (in: high G+C Gram-positive bacteria)]